MQHKTCTKCENSFPATTEYFRAKKNGKYGVASQCRACAREYGRQKATERRRATGRREIRNRQIVDGKIQCFRCKQWKPATLEHFRAQSKTKIPFRGICKACYADERLLSRDEINARKREQYPKHAESSAERARQWQKEHYDRRREYMKEYLPAYIKRPLSIAKRRTHVSNYRAKKRGLPNTFTVEDRNRALNYFGGRCAVCERPLNDLFGECGLAMDHWLPLNSPDCLGTVPQNMVPLCHGVGGCNNSKADRNPQEWLVERFGKRKASRILTRVNTFFQWVGNTAS